jgi:type IV secretory pathway VirJ component
MMKKLLFAAACVSMLAAAPSYAADETTQTFETGLIPSPHIFLPQGEVKGAVFLISDAAGWGDNEKTEADRLVSQGSVVIGVDFPSYMEALNRYDVSLNDGCIYTVSDIESLSQQCLWAHRWRPAGSCYRHLHAGCRQGRSRSRGGSEEGA